MDKNAADILANSSFITEGRIRHARREQAMELRRGVGEARVKVSEIVRRCVRFIG